MASSPWRVATALLLALGASDAVVAVNLEETSPPSDGTPPMDLHVNFQDAHLHPESTPGAPAMPAAGLTAPDGSEIPEAITHRHQHVRDVFLYVWQRMQASYGATLRRFQGRTHGLGYPPQRGFGALAPQGESSTEILGTGPPQGGASTEVQGTEVPQGGASPDSPEEEAKRSEYIMTKKKELEVALEIWAAAVEQQMRHMDTKEGIPVAPETLAAVQHQAWNAIAEYFPILDMSPNQFTSQFYAQHPRKAELAPSHPHPQPTMPVNLTPLISAADKQVEAEAEAMRKARAGNPLSDVEMRNIEMLKADALRALETQAKNNLISAEAHVFVFQNIRATSALGAKETQYFALQEAKWNTIKHEAEQALDHCKILSAPPASTRAPGSSAQQYASSSPPAPPSPELVQGRPLVLPAPASTGGSPQQGLRPQGQPLTPPAGSPVLQPSVIGQASNTSFPALANVSAPSPGSPQRPAGKTPQTTSLPRVPLRTSSSGASASGLLTLNVDA